MRFLGNIIWVVFGGFLLCLMWGVAGIVCCITIIGIPLGLQCFKFAGFVLWPFGRQVCVSSHVGFTLLNILWILLLGWELAVTSFVIGLVFFVTIIGIPFGIQCMKFALLALLPFGAEIKPA